MFKFKGEYIHKNAKGYVYVIALNIISLKSIEEKMYIHLKIIQYKILKIIIK